MANQRPLKEHLEIATCPLPSPITADGATLPDYWRNLPVRWMLNPERPDHCEACRAYAGEYASQEEMEKKIGAAFPGYFPGNASPNGTPDGYPKPDGMSACWLICTCWLEIHFEGRWQRFKQ